VSFDVYLPFIASALFGVLGSHVARRLRPAQATWLLTCGAVITTLCSFCSLLLLAWALLARLSVVASLGDWSTTIFRQHNPVNAGVSIAAIALLIAVFTRTCRAMWRHIGELAMSYRACRCLPPSAGELIVVDGLGFQARALPGRPSRIVLSKGALAALSAAERTAVLAHERSHLLHRHHLHKLVVALAAAANPALRAIPSATSFSVERWADADAVRICPPDVVASALSQATAGRATGSTAGHRTSIPPVVSPGQPDSEVFRRTRALRQPPRRRGWIVLPLAAASLAAVAFTSAEAASDAGQLMRRSDVPAVAVVTVPYALTGVATVERRRPW
jgi:hypothetical protein